MSIQELGWSPFFEDPFSEHSGDAFLPARVVRQDKHHYVLHDGSRILTGTLLGRLLYASPDPASLPAVGDWVVAAPFDDDQAVIHDVLPRFGAFYRKEAGALTRKQVIAANIDTVFLVSGLDRDFNVRRIERYLVQTSGSGAEPVVVLNKADLSSDVEAAIAAVLDVAHGVPVVPLSVKDGTGFESLGAYVRPGKTVAFLGSSGVGKSSIVNVLMGKEAQTVGAVREDDSRGRHTTSHRELFVLPAGGVVIDTPGLRELQLWGDEEDVHAVFADIEAFAEGCRFRDCRHESEPECAVLQAIEEGDLDADRFQSYLKLKREVAYLNQRQDESARIAARKREKNFGKLVKQINRHNPKR